MYCSCYGRINSDWGIPGLKVSMLFRTSSKFSAQKLASSAYSSSYLAVLLIWRSFCKSKFPESNFPDEISIKLTPLFYYPFAIAWKIGEPPRYLGKREGWITIIPFLNFLIINWGIMYPKEQTTPKSGSLIYSANCVHSYLIFALSPFALIGVE